MNKIIITTIMFLGGCATIQPQKTECFSDDRNCVLIEDLVYSIGKSNIKVRVPKGFVTDYASIPQALWSLGLSPHGRYSKAAIVHDYLYWSRDCTKQQADNILLIAMKESNVSIADQTFIYEGVNIFGKPSWESNNNEREQQLPRIIPSKYMQLPDDIEWSDYRTYLVSKGVSDPAFQKNAPYCKLGNSKQIP